MIVPILPAAPLPAEGVEPVGTVNAGQVAMHAPVHALVPLLAVSLANVYTVIPFEATMSVPLDPTVAVMIVVPPAADPLGPADAGLAEAVGGEDGAAVGDRLGSVATPLAEGDAVAALLQAATRPATTTMAAAIRFLGYMDHLDRTRRTDRGRAVLVISTLKRAAPVSDRYGC